MSFVRRLIAQRYLAVVILAAALVLKLVVPTGYMLVTEHGHFTMALCSGLAPPPTAMAMPGMHGEMPHHGKRDHGKTEMPCAFAAVSAQALSGADPTLLVLLVVFILAAGLYPAALPAIVRRSHLRPPLRGPPAFR